MNRTIYREGETGSWLRNGKDYNEKYNMTSASRETERKLKEDFGMTHVYPEDVFYRTHKISRDDFVVKLEQAKSKEDRE